MAVFHRKLLLFPGKAGFRLVFVCCGEESKQNGVCKRERSCTGRNFSLSPPPPVPPPPAFDSGIDIFSKKHFLSTTLAVMASVIACFLLFAIVCAIIRSYCRRRNGSRRRPPVLFGTQEDFLDEDHGPRLDHHIWYINTVGLDQSVIDSIAVFKFKKSDALIEGTECSVCLSEFEEDESLRLLPKCSHAFHIPCIDTWLRSHKNCPLCRAPIVSDTIVEQAAAQTDFNSNELNSAPIEVEDSHGVEEGETSEDRSGNNEEDHEDTPQDLTKISTSRSSGCEGRVLSDLGNNQFVIIEELQPMRRSVSMDSSSASTIYSAVTGISTDKKLQPRSYDSHMEKLKKSKSKSVGKRSGSGSSSLSKFMKSSSARLQKGPVPMKRSFSSGRNFLSTTRSRNQDSILPL